MEELVARAERRLRARLLQVLDDLQKQTSLKDLAALIAAGRTHELQARVEAASRQIANEINAIYLSVAQEVANEIAAQMRRPGGFSLVNERVVRTMQHNDMRLVREVGEDYRRLTRHVLGEGIRAGDSPLVMARNLRDATGLTDYQEQVVQNYRRLLLEGSQEALDRQLRDRRFDRTVLRGQVTAEQAEQMTERYRQRWKQFRARSIAQVEALRTVHEAGQEAWQQAIDNGLVDPAHIEREWHTAADAKVRDQHRPMANQKRPWGVPFTSGYGNSLMFPHQAGAPASEVVGCRCTVSTRILPRTLRSP
jgi:hypothetical protein